MSKIEFDCKEKKGLGKKLAEAKIDIFETCYILDLPQFCRVFLLPLHHGKKLFQIVHLVAGDTPESWGVDPS